MIIVENEKPGETLSTRDWLDAARTLLIREGIDAVKIGRIAKSCGVTRGGFYWRFRNRNELFAALLEEWRRTNTAPLLAVLSGGGSPAERFEAAASLWVEEKEFDPRFDTAVRNWAIASPDVADVVHKIDEERIGAFRDLFVETGQTIDEASVRARILYYHQVGYYTLRIEEPEHERKRLLPLYNRILTGLEPSGKPANT